MDISLMKRLAKPSESKILLLVMDGLGGIPENLVSSTELETAKTPNLDDLARGAVTGLHEPVGPGITPGSGPGHLSLFGYDPLQYEVGRGVLSALGIDFDLQAGDVAARGNFCSLDEQGKVTDRRAGRISTERNRELCELLRSIELPGVELLIETVKEHRFLIVMRGKDLSGEVTDTDAQQPGDEPLDAKAKAPGAEETARLINEFARQAREKLASHHPANMVLLRGFSRRPDWPTMPEVYKFRPAAIAAYPMYRGVARLVGMDILETGDSAEEEFDTLEKHWKEYDFFYLHMKRIDSAGEDGAFDRKVELIEEVDEQVRRMRHLRPDVVVVTGDHSTPSVLRSHSWHPVPVLIWSKHCSADRVEKFSERDCTVGALGPRFRGCDLMAMAMANARRLVKFGA